MNNPDGSPPDVPSFKFKDAPLMGDQQTATTWDGGSRKIIVPEFPDIAGMFNKIRYVQPDPLPQHIDYLMMAGLRGLDFVRIPITSETDSYYLRSSIIKLIELCGLRRNDIEELIDQYQKPDPTEKIKTALHGMYQTARYYCDSHNIEFL